MNTSPVLYVEDEQNDIIFMEKAFARAEVRNPLVAVLDGQAAIDYLGVQHKYSDRGQYPMPCLVLLDLNLPKKTGLEVLEWIRHHPACYTLPVVVVSSSSRELDVHKSYALGANAYVVKPPLLNELQAAVKTIKDFWLSLNQPPPELQTTALIGR